MKKNKNKIIGYPNWANKSWWVQPDELILTEHLKILIGIKKNVPNIDAKIHEISTVIALRYISSLVFKNGQVLKEDVNPNPRKGPDIYVEGVTSTGQSCKCHAEVVTNFSFKYGQEAKKLFSDVKKLIDLNADKKYLIVLFNQLIEEAAIKCKNRRRNKIDLDKNNIQILSIEKIIGSNI